ncbi:MAG: cadherin-like beta sandwich domain-containing protein, partial [Prevotellaceae bacterium]|nr:cadherin-like beta sandwich domain-containing protein [Prevotellaceae bacterium]
TQSGDITWTVTETNADNRLCAYATTVSVGDTTKSTLKANTSRWYKLTAQAGKTYEISGSGSYTPSVAILSGTCDDLDEVMYSYSSAPLLFQPKETGEYYIQYSYSSTSESVWSWQVREVTENTICANATAVAENAQVSNTHTGGKSRWYTFTTSAAGKYDVNAPAGQTVRVWAGCGGSTPLATASGSATFDVAANVTYYIEWVAAASYEYSYKWSISQHAAARLTELSVGYPLSPEFTPSTTSYTVNVPNSVDKVTIYAAAPDGAAITGDTGEKTLSEGNNPFTVTVTLEGESKTYTITVRRAPENASDDATLSTLTVSSGSLTPAFSTDVTSYTVSVGNDVSSITIAATATDEGATVNGADEYGLNVGANTFTVTVIAEDAKAEKSYSIIVTRAAAEVLSVTVAPATADVQKGSTQQFTVTVAVTGGLAQTVTWSVAGNTSAGTSISATGLLTVADDETSTTLTVTATPTADVTKQGTVTVTVTAVAETGVERQLTAAIAPYPNPFTGALHLAGAEGCTLRVISASGATVYFRLITSTNETIHLESLSAGLYFLHFEKDGKHKTLQVVKQ